MCTLPKAPLGSVELLLLAHKSALGLTATGGHGLWKQRLVWPFVRFHQAWQPVALGRVLLKLWSFS